MNRRKFLDGLARIWEEDGEMAEPLTLEDLLDDAGTLGLLGASGLYMRLIREGSSSPEELTK